MISRTLLGAVLSIGFTLAAFAVEDSWAKVKKLVSGVELRVTADNTRTSTYTLDLVRENALILIRGNTQLAILRPDIEKIELKLPNAKARAKIHAKSEFPQVPDGRVNKTTTGGVTIRTDDPDYLLIYRRADPPTK